MNSVSGLLEKSVPKSLIVIKNNDENVNTGFARFLA